MIEQIPATMLELRSETWMTDEMWVGFPGEEGAAVELLGGQEQWLFTSQYNVLQYFHYGKGTLVLLDQVSGLPI